MVGKRTHGLIVAAAVVAFGATFGMQTYHAGLERTEHSLMRPESQLVRAIEACARQNPSPVDPDERASAGPAIVVTGTVVSVDLGDVYE